MQLPPSLREAIDRELEGTALRDLAGAADVLSQRYRAELRDGRLHVNDDLAARAYLTTRLPATFASISAALGAVAETRPDFAPQTLLDAGAGPGTAIWAAAQRWDSLHDALAIEASPVIRAVGERLSHALAVDRTAWLTRRLEDGLADLAERDLVLLAYVLVELSPSMHDSLIKQLWRLTADTLVIVEPGTPEGWIRILGARDLLIGAGAHLLAPCPHHHTCPLVRPDWCHFSARLPRSRLHREAKGGTVPWEDEKFIYLAVARQPGIHPEARVIAPPHGSKAAVTLKLCQKDGHVAEQSFAKRDGASFKTVRKLRWGDVLLAES
ncbi:small ribosomal subunit Rsm22 family protein [Dongia deserti]|uniref:small ribosomal subunit Rsm22 family protein n=1 Tax=Dongia deserti TaxID=2268030 RepID=UPI000E64D0FD|nr:small ribosomal subunit Rsm22 family protein [Dongia deserti]